MMTIVALITLVFISRDMKKVDVTKMSQDFALKPRVDGRIRTKTSNPNNISHFVTH